jgi:hypothetical protein
VGGIYDIIYRLTKRHPPPGWASAFRKNGVATGGFTRR